MKNGQANHDPGDAGHRGAAKIDPPHELPPDPVEEPLTATAAAAEIERLQEETRRLTEERDTLNDRLLRAVAEADNYRKRVQRELTEARLHATTETVRPFLAVLDGFERAGQHAAMSGGGGAAEMRQGIELLRRQLLEAARKVGLEPVEAVGQPFDPHLHEAIEMVDAEDAAEGAVVEELQRGYKLKDRLIRPAMVKVARPKS